MHDKANYEEMKRVLDIDWVDTLHACGDDIHEMWEAFKCNIEETEN